MKAVCIKSMHKNGLKNGLLKGKAYEVEKQEHSDGNWLIVKCDDGIRRLFTKDVFQSIRREYPKQLFVTM